MDNEPSLRTLLDELTLIKDSVLATRKETKEVSDTLASVIKRIEVLEKAIKYRPKRKASEFSNELKAEVKSKAYY